MTNAEFCAELTAAFREIRVALREASAALHATSAELERLRGVTEFQRLLCSPVAAEVPRRVRERWRRHRRSEARPTGGWPLPPVAGTVADLPRAVPVAWPLLAGMILAWWRLPEPASYVLAAVYGALLSLWWRSWWQRFYWRARWTWDARAAGLARFSEKGVNLTFDRLSPPHPL